MRHVARINQTGFERAPSLFADFQLRAVEAIVEQRAAASAQVYVEVIRLQTIRHRSHFAELAVLEFQQRHRGRVIFIRVEDRTPRAVAVTRHLFNLGIHKHQQQIERVAACGQQTASAEIFFDVPRELAVPRAYAVIVINLGVVQIAEQPLVNCGLDDVGLLAETDFKADTGLHARFADRLTHGHRVFVFDRDRFFDDQMFAGFRRRNRLFGVQRMRRADVYDVDRGVFQHRIIIAIGFERRSVLPLQFFFVQLAARADGGDFRSRNFVEGRDVRSRDPAQADYANVDVIHLLSPFDFW